MARAATETQQAGLTGPGVRARDPGHGRRRRVGERRRPRRRTPPRSSSPRRCSSPTAPRPCWRPRELGLRLPPQPVQGREPARRERPAEIVLGAVVPARARPTRPRSRRGWTTSARWRREHQPLGIPSAGSVFRNPRRRLRRAAGRRARASRATVIGGAVGVREARQLHRQRPHGTAADVRRLAEHVRAEVRGRHGIELAFEVEFVGRLVRLRRPRRPPDARAAARPTIPPRRRSPSSSAARRRSTTCRSCRDRRSPTRSPASGLPGRDVAASTSTAAGGGCPTGSGATAGRRRTTTTRARSARPGPSDAGEALERARGARAVARRVPRPPRPVRRGRHGAGAVRGGRASRTRARA